MLLNVQLQEDIADVGNFRHTSYRDNLVLEVSMAGAWISLLLWGVMIGFMIKVSSLSTGRVTHLRYLLFSRLLVLPSRVAMICTAGHTFAC